MVALRQSTDYNTAQQWWNDARSQTGTFFRLIDSRPTDTPGMPVLSAMMDLHTAGQKLSRLSTPSECREARQHLLNAMRYLQLSLAEIIAHNPDSSDSHYDSARDEYHRLRRTLRELRVQQVT
jgi:hypothetical protein